MTPREKGRGCGVLGVVVGWGGVLGRLNKAFERSHSACLVSVKICHLIWTLTFSNY